MTSGTKITRITGRRVWDSRGRPTVEAEITLANGTVGRAIAPAGASRGSNEAIDLRDGGAAFGGLGVQTAVDNLNTLIAPLLTGRDVEDQLGLDQALIALDGTAQKSHLGGNSIIAVSMAAAHAAANVAGLPLWRYLSGNNAPRLPMPMVQIFGGGAHAEHRLDVQDYLIVPIGAHTFDEATVMVANVYRAAGDIMAERGLKRGVADEGGWWPEFASNEAPIETTVTAIERAGYRPGEDIGIALDIAASQFSTNHSYRFAAEKTAMDTAQLVERITGWCKRYPIVSIEDAVAEDDDAGMTMITKALGNSIQIIGDDYLVTSAARIKAAAARGACNAVLLKPNQVGTLSETKAALEQSNALGWNNIVSARSGETEDITIVHLAVGWGADQLKVGSFARSERMAKWNEAIRIEQSAPGGASLQNRFKR